MTMHRSPAKGPEGRLSPVPATRAQRRVTAR
ncbi:hypothetical protein FraQA3DRAFT_3815 [Frankia sp. QA3]|nr:hypothetical protein FraQA3DRAFT_3815 [Frankia sp. QA3]